MTANRIASEDLLPGGPAIQTWVPATCCRCGEWHSCMVVEVPVERWPAALVDHVQPMLPPPGDPSWPCTERRAYCRECAPADFAAYNAWAQLEGREPIPIEWFTSPGGVQEWEQRALAGRYTDGGTQFLVDESVPPGEIRFINTREMGNYSRALRGMQYFVDQDAPPSIQGDGSGQLAYTHAVEDVQRLMDQDLQRHEQRLRAELDLAARVLADDAPRQTDTFVTPVFGRREEAGPPVPAAERAPRQSATSHLTATAAAGLEQRRTRRVQRGPLLGTFSVNTERGRTEAIVNVAALLPLQNGEPVERGICVVCPSTAPSQLCVHRNMNLLRAAMGREPIAVLHGTRATICVNCLARLCSGTRVPAPPEPPASDSMYVYPHRYALPPVTLGQDRWLVGGLRSPAEAMREIVARTPTKQPAAPQQLAFRFDSE